MMEINKHLFICGMSRGGTTWLGNCLNEHPSVAVFGESLYWGRNYKEPAKDGYSESQISEVLSLLSMGATAFLGDGPGNLKHVKKSKWREVKYLKVPCPCPPATLYSNVCGWIASEEEVDSVIEKTPHHIDWIPRIKESLPDAKFVMMVRDPYSFMLSYKHQGDRKSSTTKRNFDKLYHPLGCAFVWRRYMMSTLSAEANYSGSVLRVEFQLLRNEPSRVWHDVLRFFDLPDAPLLSVGEQNSSFPRERPKLESVDVFWMNLIAGRVMRNANYELEKSSVRGMDILKSFCLLIPWGVFVAQHLGQKVSGGVLKYLKLTKWR